MPHHQRHGAVAIALGVLSALWFFTLTESSCNADSAGVLAWLLHCTTILLPGSEYPGTQPVPLKFFLLGSCALVVVGILWWMKAIPTLPLAAWWRSFNTVTPNNAPPQEDEQSKKNPPA